MAFACSLFMIIAVSYLYPLVGVGMGVGAGLVVGYLHFLMPAYRNWVLVRKRKRLADLKKDVVRLESEIAKSEGSK
jgi:hypothetical protein